MVSNEHWNGLCQRTPRQGGRPAGVLVGSKAVFTTQSWGVGGGGYDSLPSGLDLRKRGKSVHAWTSRLEGASESNPFTWPPPRIFRPAYFFQTHRLMNRGKNAQTLSSLCPSLCLPMPRPLASPLCGMWQVGDVTAVLMPDEVWPKSQHTQTQSSTNAIQGALLQGEYGGGKGAPSAFYTQL